MLISKKYIALIVLLSGITVCSAAAPSHLKWMSFYDTEPWTQAGFCNASTHNDLALINDGAKRGIGGFVNIGDVFLKETWNGTGGAWSGYDLKADYELCWKVFADLIAPSIASGHVKGFMILDEPIWNGLTVAQLATIANTIKAKFPTTIVWVTEAAPVFTQNLDIFNAPVNISAVPAGIDWIGFDMYTTPSAVRTAYETYLYPKMNANQKAFLIPQAWGTAHDPSKTLAQIEAEMVAAADAYYAWAASDTRIVGMIPWHWLAAAEKYWTGDYTLFEYGAGQMPLLRSKWIQIGSDIRANNVIAPKATDMSLIQGFDALGVPDGQRLPSNYTDTPWGANPEAPLASKVFFSVGSTTSTSGNTSIMMMGPTGWRYCWGTNAQNPGRLWPGHPVQFFQFNAWFDQSAQTMSMDVGAYRHHSKVLTLNIGSGGIGFTDGKISTALAAWNQLHVFDNSNLASGWNKFKVKIDLGDMTTKLDDKLTIWINDVVKYNGSFIAQDEVCFDTIGFFMSTNNSVIFDDIGMWSQIGCGEWGYYGADINKDCKVSFADFAQMMEDWSKCTDPASQNCLNVK